MFQFSMIDINAADYAWHLLIAIILGSYIIYKFIISQRFVKDITKKSVFITGCDRGFGRALASQLDALGCPVFAGCLTEDAAKQLQDQSSAKMQTFQLDVTSSESVKMAYEFVKKNLQPDCVLWGVVNNAGIGDQGPIEFMTKSEFEKVLQVNVLGQVDVINTFLPSLKRNKGRIVNISSLSGKVAAPNSAAYTASKFAVYGYTEALRREKKMWGIGVSTIMPGLYKTNMATGIPEQWKKQWIHLPQDLKDEYGQDFQDLRIKFMEGYTQRIAKSDITPVINSIKHALFSVKPKATYLIGLDAKVIVFLESLPFGIMDILCDIMQVPVIPKILKN